MPSQSGFAGAAGYPGGPASYDPLNGTQRGYGWRFFAGAAACTVLLGAALGYVVSRPGSQPTSGGTTANHGNTATSVVTAAPPVVNPGLPGTSPGAPVGSASLVQTSGDVDRLARKPDVSVVPDFVFQGPVIDIDANTLGQDIVGFGGAFTEASALQFRKLPGNLQEQLLDHYFGPDGIGYTLGRVPIHSCDFSPTSYTFDDVPGDFDLAHFDDSVAHDTESLIPFIKRAKQKIEASGNTLKLLATPWSPPAWMKTNNNMDTSFSPCLRGGYQATWAKYIVRWLSAYQAQQLPIWAITVQNEPLANSSWEACVMTSAEEASFLGDHLGPAMRQTHPDVNIFIYDDSKQLMVEYAQAAYNHPTAKEYVDGVAFHWYTGDWFNNVAQVHREYPQAILLASEATYERSQWKPGTLQTYAEFRFGEGYAHDIIGDLNAGSSGWIDWNLVLDISGGPNHVGNVCDAAMVVDFKTQKLHLHPQYYFVGHFAKFIPPGSKHLGTTVQGSKAYAGALRRYGTCTGDDGLEAVSFVRPDQQIVTVVLNCGETAVEFKIRHSAKAPQGACAIRSTIPAHSIQTYMFAGCGSSR